VPVRRLGLAAVVLKPRPRTQPRDHIAALCLQHGVSELRSADRDFPGFPQLKVRNPLLKQ